MKIYYKQKGKRSFEFIKYEQCCENMKPQYDYLPDGLSWDSKHGTIDLMNSEEYGTPFEGVSYCPFCGTKIQFLDISRKPKPLEGTGGYHPGTDTLF